DFTWKSPGFAQTDEHPVTIVTHDDALAFTGWLTRTSGRAFTLPTEAQWEHAYRAGTTGAYYAAESEALALGWFKPNAGNGTRPVGQKKPNALGLHDLGGNVHEWCLDWYAVYGAGLAVDPVATTPDASDKPRRVLRGGSWLKDAKSGRAAARYRNAPGSRNADNGFRVAADTRASVERSTPAPLPASPPNGSRPPTGSSERPTSTANKVAGGFIFSGICFGAIAFVGLLLTWIGRSRKKAAALPAAPLVGSRIARDGFWIDAPGHLVGSLVRYRYRAADGSMHDGQVRVEGAPSGQYVYTGHAPSTMLALQIIDMTSAPSRRSHPSWSSPQPRYSETSTTSDDVAPFVGYPSAY
ncbi:MAG: formylglycine-generating enzyme family protein, partial [Byssovorax sp.]